MPLSASETDFRKALGNPDGTIKMGADRRGLFYGQRLLLIFSHGKLWQVHGWDTNPNIDFWGYVTNDRTRDSMRLVFPGWSPWDLTWQQFAQHDKEFPVEDADEVAEDRTAGKGSMTVYYDPCYSVRNSGCVAEQYWNQFLVNRIEIRFESTAIQELPPAK